MLAFLYFISVKPATDEPAVVICDVQAARPSNPARLSRALAVTVAAKTNTSPQMMGPCIEAKQQLKYQTHYMLNA